MEDAACDDAVYRRLAWLLDNREEWESSVDEVGSLLTGSSNRIAAKALWVFGEMGLRYPQLVEPYLDAAAAHLRSENPHLRERAVCALGRIGRAEHALVLPYFDVLMELCRDPASDVRMHGIWACENIATTAPELFESRMDAFAHLLGDDAERVRMEAPEIFRVVGKRRRDLVEPYLPELRTLAETDENRVVRIHAAGAVKAAG